MNKTESAGATDPAVEPAKPRGAKFATRQATVPKPALAAAAKAANSGSDGDSAAAKAPKPAAKAVSAKKTAQAPAKTEDVPRQRPTNNQLLCVSRRTASRERALGRAGARNLRVFDVARGAAGARRRGRDRARARARRLPGEIFFPSALPPPLTSRPLPRAIRSQVQGSLQLGALRPRPHPGHARGPPPGDARVRFRDVRLPPGASPSRSRASALATRATITPPLPVSRVARAHAETVTPRDAGPPTARDRRDAIDRAPDRERRAARRPRARAPATPPAALPAAVRRARRPSLTPPASRESRVGYG